MTNKVNCKTATDVSERCSVSVFTVKESILLKLLDHKDERNKILRNVYNCFFYSTRHNTPEDFNINQS